MATVDPSFPVAIATAEQLLAAGDLGRCELVAGRLVMMSPAGFEHGLIAQRIAAAIQAHAEPRRLGVVVAAETGFLLQRSPDTVRAADVAFVGMNRLAEMDRCPTGFFEGAPDVVIEVLSPSDRRDRAALQRVHAKVDEWLAAGAIEVWTVDPGRQMVTIYRPQQDSGPVAASATFAADATLRSNALPGFSLPLSTIFRRPQDT
jgi:Uma2 family endonuclease